MSQLVVRGSEVQAFLRCRKKWNWEWNEGYQARQQNNKLAFGTLFHKFLEVLYNTKDQQQAFDVAHELYLSTETQEDVWEMFEPVALNYIEKWWRNDEDWEIVATEYHFQIELDEQIVYEGTIDLIFKDGLGRIWFADHKTSISIDKYEKNAVMDRQISRYWWALTKLGMEPYGFIYNIILKDYPVPPKVLKGGKLSQAKNQNTTYQLYKQAIQEHGLAYEDYVEFLDYLVENPREYFKRVIVRRTDKELASAMHEFYYTARESGEVKHAVQTEKYGAETRLYRNITSDCSWDCAFYQICQLDIQGESVENLLNTLFTKEEK